MKPVVVFDGGVHGDPRIGDLVQRLGIPAARDDEEYDWVLTVESAALVLRRRDESRRPALSVDLVRTRKRFRSLPISRRGPLAQALGRNTGRVVDATAGWGQDTILAWMMGYEVVAIERSPVIGALLADGLHRFECFQPAPSYPKLVIGDARTYLADHGADCVYLDPMFAPKSKAALAKRPMRVLRELVGDDIDRHDLFECAWRAAGRRVVTKRPVHEKPWGRPDHTIGGKLMCYDIYLKHP